RRIQNLKFKVLGSDERDLLEYGPHECFLILKFFKVCRKQPLYLHKVEARLRTHYPRLTPLVRKKIYLNLIELLKVLH
ncbi:hypothetical protein H5410_048689, partial [Solanum commersonii]